MIRALIEAIVLLEKHKNHATQNPYFSMYYNKSFIRSWKAMHCMILQSNLVTIIIYEVPCALSLRTKIIS